MIVDIPKVDWVVTEFDLEDVEDALERMNRDNARRARSKRIRIYRARVAPWLGFAAAIKAITAAMTAHFIVVQITSTPSAATRRRRRTSLCLAQTYAIVRRAHDFLDDRVLTRRALQSNPNDPRPYRTYRSRR